MLTSLVKASRTAENYKCWSSSERSLLWTTTATTKNTKKERCKDTLARKGVVQWFATGCTLQQMARCPGLLDDLWFMDTGLSNGCQAWQLMKAQNASYFGSPQNIGHFDTVVKENQAIFFTATKHKRQGNNQYFYQCWGSASFCTTDMELQYSQTFERSCLKIFTATQRCVYNHDITLVLEKYDRGNFAVCAILDQLLIYSACHDVDWVGEEDEN